MTDCIAIVCRNFGCKFRA